MLVAAAQTNPRLRDKATNLEVAIGRVREAAAAGARLVVFPECGLTGYQYETREEAIEDAEPIPGPMVDRVAAVAAETGAHVAVGLVERDGPDIFNGAALVGPEGLIAKYRKTHLPWEAVDRLVRPGNIPLLVRDTPIGRLGILICYDLRFPEPARVLALRGCEVIVNLTNLPPGGEPQPDFMFRTRAAENRVYIVAADRVGEERGVRFIGRSAIVDPTGRTLAEGSGSDEELVLAEIDPVLARQKDLLFKPGLHELHLFQDRRPDLYGALVEPVGTPGRPDPSLRSGGDGLPGDGHPGHPEQAPLPVGR